MDKFIFVTGFHRAGTHTFAETIAKERNLIYLDENSIGLTNYRSVIELSQGIIPQSLRGGNIYMSSWEKIYIGDKFVDRLRNDGFVLQCPGIAHKTLELSKIGKVYWCTRNTKNLVTSMLNVGMGFTLWDYKKAFLNEFPNDSVWENIIYYNKDKNDAPYGFPKFARYLVELKNYFYDTKFKESAKRVVLEDQSYYKNENTLVYKRPMKIGASKLFEEVDKIYESSCPCLS